MITLAIIGVVAALTIPTLTQHYKKKTIETKLVRVYSLMNQAISLSEIDNGPKETWDFEDDNFWDTYFDKYVKSIKKENAQGTSYKLKCIYFADGSMLMHKTSDDTLEDGSIKPNTGKNEDYFFYPDAKKFNALTYQNEYGRTNFSFRFAPNTEGLHEGKGFEVLMHAINTNQDYENQLINGYYGCRKNNLIPPAYCTALIKHNGWKIPDNYPFEF